MTKTIAKASYIAVLDIQNCLGCGDCIEQCPTGAIPHNLIGLYSHLLNIDKLKCNGCGVCISVCTQNAIKLIKTT
jgi:ferredoxin